MSWSEHESAMRSQADERRLSVTPERQQEALKIIKHRGVTHFNECIPKELSIEEVKGTYTFGNGNIAYVDQEGQGWIFPYTEERAQALSDLGYRSGSLFCPTAEVFLQMKSKPGQ